MSDRLCASYCRHLNTWALPKLTVKDVLSISSQSKFFYISYIYIYIYPVHLIVGCQNCDSNQCSINSAAPAPKVAKSNKRVSESATLTDWRDGLPTIAAPPNYHYNCKGWSWPCVPWWSTSGKIQYTSLFHCLAIKPVRTLLNQSNHVLVRMYNKSGTNISPQTDPYRVSHCCHSISPVII